LPIRLDYNTISRIQQANDIVELISEYLRLDKKGKELVGICPFHTDHRPSLYVSPAKQIFKCFACGAGGDVIKFVQMREGLTFPQALERLAKRAGIDLGPELRREGSKQRSGELDAAALVRINQWALKLWQQNLWHPEKGATARNYLAKRQISEESARKWGLGLAVDAWDDLTAQAARKSRRPDYLAAAGLAVSKETGGYYDKFRNRLMFPIIDVGGRIIGFGGRTLGDDPAKYMNSPATALFDKSHCLYGLDQARHVIGQSGTAVVVEGYTDVMMAHQFGVGNVVATLGTSLTEGHAHLLRRFAKRIVLLFDSDVAGRAAAQRALEVCLAEKIDIRLAFVPEGKDPCDYLLQFGAEAFRGVIENAQEVMEYVWDRLVEDYTQSRSLADREAAVRKFLQYVAAGLAAGRMDSLARNLLICRIGELIGLSAGKVEESLRKYHKTASSPAPAQAEAPAAEPLSPYQMAQRDLLETMLNAPALAAEHRGQISVQLIDDPVLRQIATVLLECLDQGIRPDAATLCGQMESPEETRQLLLLAEQGEAKGEYRLRFEEALRVLHDERDRRQARQIKQQIREEDSQSLRQITDLLRKQKVNPRCAGLRPDR
jgi:DNA primase